MAIRDNAATEIGDALEPEILEELHRTATVHTASANHHDRSRAVPVGGGRGKRVEWHVLGAPDAVRRPAVP